MTQRIGQLDGPERISSLLDEVESIIGVPEGSELADLPAAAAEFRAVVESQTQQDRRDAGISSSQWRTWEIPIPGVQDLDTLHRCLTEVQLTSRCDEDAPPEEVQRRVRQFLLKRVRPVLLDIEGRFPTLAVFCKPVDEITRRHHPRPINELALESLREVMIRIASALRDLLPSDEHCARGLSSRTPPRRSVSPPDAQGGLWSSGTQAVCALEAGDPREVSRQRHRLVDSGELKSLCGDLQAIRSCDVDPGFSPHLPRRVYQKVLAEIASMLPQLLLFLPSRFRRIPPVSLLLSPPASWPSSVDAEDFDRGLQVVLRQLRRHLPKRQRPEPLNPTIEISAQHSDNHEVHAMTPAPPLTQAKSPGRKRKYTPRNLLAALIAKLDSPRERGDVKAAEKMRELKGDNVSRDAVRARVASFAYTLDRLPDEIAEHPNRLSRFRESYPSIAARLCSSLPRTK